MGSLFRSEKMTLVQLFLQSEAAYACVRELGELGKVQFRDLNPDVSVFQRKFTNEVRRCDEMERKLCFLSTELEKAGIMIQPAPPVEAPDPPVMIDLESKIEVLESEVKEINTGGMSGSATTCPQSMGHPRIVTRTMLVVLPSHGLPWMGYGSTIQRYPKKACGSTGHECGSTKHVWNTKETLKKNLLDLIELQHILEKTQGFFHEAEQYSMITPPIATPAPMQTKFTFLTGVINRERVATFERVLWRACRGNVFLRQAEILEPLEDPTKGLQYKIVFILFFQGDQWRSRVRRICETFRATLYQCPETADERQEMTVAVLQRINDLRAVLHITEQHYITLLTEIAQELDTWRTKVTKIKAIYYTLNMFNLDMTQRCLIAECWCPVEDLDEIQRALTRGTERSGSTVPSTLNRVKTEDNPPAYNKLNKFTSGFQAIVDAYGVATYEEVNPTPYTIITFPFLFAVMFGDAGHGLIMALFALLLIVFEKKLANSDAGGEMFRTIYNGRYIMFLMGVFSIYTGLVYNDVFSKSLNIFGSSWNASFSESNLTLEKLRFEIINDEFEMNEPPKPKLEKCCVQTNPCSAEGCCGNCTDYNCAPTNCVILGAKEAELTVFPREAMNPLQPYPFGLDPIWNVAENKLLYTNSYKMKMAVILGIGQMLFGVILSIFNHVHFKRYINIFVEFIPQVLFLLGLFGWLVFMIVYKWCIQYENPNTAPSLLITLINMFLELGQAPQVFVPTSCPNSNLANEYSVFGPSASLANAQRYFQILLVIVAIGCIPVMLCIKPFYLLAKHKKKGKPRHRPGSTYNIQDSDSTVSQIIQHDKEEEGAEPYDMEKQGPKGGEHGNDEFEFGEAFVHQAIHTIEYCLGTISNTASYLRLWVLSLAHAELSEVLWTMVFARAIAMGVDKGPAVGAIAVFCIFSFWAVLTIGILLVMEGLSAFLHALRLHWVEFQNKFYDGNGYKFQPFSFEVILKGEDQD